MYRRGSGPLWLGVALVVLAACSPLPSPAAQRRLDPSSKTAPPPQESGPDITLAATPTVTRSWTYWPNAVDFRDLAVDGDALWVAALSGLVRYEPLTGHWRVWTSRDGLVDNRCESVVLWEGEIWIGTQGGVSRYDPKLERWRSYTQDQGLPGVRNTRLYVDTFTGKLWASTFDGIASYNPGTDRWTEYTVDGAPFPGVTSFWADPEYLWIAMSPFQGDSIGIWHLDRATGTWSAVDGSSGLSSPGPYTLIGADERLWAISRQGPSFEYDAARHTFGQLDKGGRGLSGRYAFPAYRTPLLWLWDGKRWVRYNPQRIEVSYLAYPEEAALQPQGRIAFQDAMAWVPTRAGLLALDLERGTWKAHIRTDPPASVDHLYWAQNGLLLLSARGQLGLYNPLSGEWHILLDLSTIPLSGTFDIALDKDEQDLWLYQAPLQDVESARKALELWRLELADDGSEIHPSSLQPPEEISLPRHLLPGVDGGRLWFLADDAVVAYQPSAGTWYTYPVRSRAGYLGAAEQEPGSLWFLSGEETLVHFDTRRHSLTMQPIPYGQGWSRIEVLEETVWLAGDSNLVLSTSQDLRHWEQHVVQSECIGYSISAMAGSDRALWITGEDGVIRLETDTGEEKCFTRAEGMLADTASQLFTDPSGVWFSHSGYGLWGYTTVRTNEPQQGHPERVPYR